MRRRPVFIETYAAIRKRRRESTSSANSAANPAAFALSTITHALAAVRESISPRFIGVDVLHAVLTAELSSPRRKRPRVEISDDFPLSQPSASRPSRPQSPDSPVSFSQPTMKLSSFSTHQSSADASTSSSSSSAAADSDDSLVDMLMHATDDDRSPATASSASASAKSNAINNDDIEMEIDADLAETEAPPSLESMAEAFLISQSQSQAQAQAPVEPRSPLADNGLPTPAPPAEVSVATASVVADEVTDDDLLAIEETWSSGTSAAAANSSFSSSSSSSSSAAVSPQTVADIEDLGGLMPLLRHKRGGALSVSDLSSQLWCELQKDFTIRLGKRVSVEAAAIMAKGTERHTVLEAAVHDIVEIPTRTREDIHGLRFLNMILRLQELSSLGITRELPVISCFQAQGRTVWAVGVIDEVKRVPLANRTSSSAAASGDSATADLKRLQSLLASSANGKQRKPTQPAAAQPPTVRKPADSSAKPLGKQPSLLSFGFWQPRAPGSQPLSQSSSTSSKASPTNDAKAGLSSASPMVIDDSDDDEPETSKSSNSSSSDSKDSKAEKQPRDSSPADSASAAPSAPPGAFNPKQFAYRIIDTKTRRNRSLPSIAQKRTSRMQLMLYKRMFDTLTDGGISAARFLSDHGLKPESTFSAELTDHLKQCGLAKFTLGQLVELALFQFTSFPHLDDSLAVEYEFQGDHSALGQDVFAHEPRWLADEVQFLLEYWLGQRAPTAVSIDESWKCRWCEFHPECAARPPTVARTPLSVEQRQRYDQAAQLRRQQSLANTAAPPPQTQLQTQQAHAQQSEEKREPANNSSAANPAAAVPENTLPANSSLQLNASGSHADAAIPEHAAPAGDHHAAFDSVQLAAATDGIIANACC